jgi:hypothetical protein
LSAKAKGSRREREVRDFLLQRGFKVCKAGASLGEWDLIAVNGHVFLLVQVKSNRFCYPEERATLEAFEAPIFNTHKLQAQVADRKGIAFRVYKEGSWQNVTGLRAEGISTGPAVWFKPPARRVLAL